MKEYGLDLSKHNGNVDFYSVKNNGNLFVILRAGYGKTVSQKDQKFEEYYAAAKKAGLKVGAYWYSYALSKEDAKKEAQTCLEVIKGKTFEYPVWLDMEDADGYKKEHGGVANNVLCEICEVFCKELEDNGYYTGVYASESWFNNQLKNMSQSYDRWVANWGTNNGTLQSDKSSTYKLHQFTSNYSINGKRYDRNISYRDYATTIKNNGLNGYNKETAPTTKKSVDEIVKEVINGQWGNGEERKQKLASAGYDYNEIQEKVNSLLGVTVSKKSVDEIAKEVINGKWGNGEERKQKLALAGYDYDAIQEKVNSLLGADTRKTVQVGSKVNIKSGAVYGGLSSSRGKSVPSYVLKQTHTVSKIQTNKGVKEALLKEINSWVAVSSLTVK